MTNTPKPLRVIFDARYDYVGFHGWPAHCWLRAYVFDNAGDLPVVIVTELPTNEGTSVTNIAEELAWRVMRDPEVWGEAPGAAREGVIWLEHYPGEPDAPLFFEREHFSIVTFTYDPDTEEEEGAAHGTLHMVRTDPETGEIEGIQSFTLQPGDDDDTPYGSEGQPAWRYIQRQEAEALIGQPFPPVPGERDIPLADDE